MCGIAGEIDLSKGVQKKNFFLKKLSHRGPHNEKFFKIDNNICFYHTRLKIIDLSDKSNQPMLSYDRRYIISYNGELYNYVELKKKLEKLGFFFKTTGDTEVFLNGFIKFGKNFFKIANGIFAVSIYDRKEKILYLARDFIGVKPLYYSLKNNNFVFASEAKAIINNVSDKTINKKAINEFLFYKYISGKDTLVKNVYKFDPGKVYSIDLKKKHIKLKSFTYYQFKELNKKYDIKETIHNTKLLLTKSVNLQLQSDANLGIQLSGGIDSTLITEIANTTKKIKFLYFSGFENYKKDERKYANFVSKKLKIKFQKSILNKNFFFKNLNKTIYHLDAPLNHPHSLAIYQISKNAKKNISVMLAGEGADEIFFGYERYLKIIKERSIINFIKNGAFLRTKKDIELYNIFKNKKFGDAHANRIKIFKDINIENNLKRFQIFETKTHLQSLLTRSDKMMMANSIEARVPFLDTNLFNYAININEKIKKNQEQKIILKKILSQFNYPSNFISRKKIGYIIPFNEWLESIKNYEKELKTDSLLTLFKKKDINFLIDDLKNRNNMYSNAKIYWLLINISKFIKTFDLNIEE